MWLPSWGWVPFVLNPFLMIYVLLGKKRKHTPKKKGRPFGSKDKYPRFRRTKT